MSTVQKFNQNALNTDTGMFQTFDLDDFLEILTKVISRCSLCTYPRFWIWLGVDQSLIIKREKIILNVKGNKYMNFNKNSIFFV